MTSLRARKKRATAQALAHAAYALATQRGVEQVTTDDIASEAGVSRRTFANYYANKHAAVVDGFLQNLGITIWHPDDPTQPGDLPTTFKNLVESSHEFISGVFTDSANIGQIQEFAKMVRDNPALEPYIHAVFLEFQHSRVHKILAERFGEAKVSLFIGALIGSLGGLVRLVLGPLAIPRNTPPLRGVSPAADPGDYHSSNAPIFTPDDVAEVLDHIDQAFSYLRHGFVGQ